jgi:hypothetical protein
VKCPDTPGGFKDAAITPHGIVLSRPWGVAFDAAAHLKVTSPAHRK